MIKLESVSKRFVRPDGAQVKAVDRLDLEVAQGQIVALLGTSGSGKTTTLRLINALERPDGGRVSVDGCEVGAVDPVQLRRGLGYVVQEGGLFPHLTVAGNVGLLCELEGQTRVRIRRRVDELLALVQLEPGEFAARYPHELSGGQRQRVGVARALALDPPVLLMDEPFGALDPLTRREVRREFAQLHWTLGKTVLLVTHDVREAFELADLVGVMSAGRIVQLGSPQELQARPANEFVESFLTEVRGV
ncbi:ATP-binding cassette domain-containing protein [Engelhardtia mirabilis]|uniref:Glycine betaine/carnitine/choline transport ATP-binding protein OpuCA n=1 Tax=Engelhardtia mirabilis TaxID=2528011 RepID=A0A518BR46_9BACT|nr:Glycine betaine/carnitine/choline transport ATP-binding protein OpuCA [Planctomycetes bacterium Pla133]QDV03746.1 Glycine betaine/carnitine/choline transport ATP-binding protein OpuCA [Planctomycetes bacterium Pla86]